MLTVKVDLGERAYPIHIGGGLLETPELLRPLLDGARAVVVTNDVVAPLYLDRVRTLLEEHFAEAIILPDGEAHKTLATVESIYDRLLAGKFDRRTVLVALGGGVVGDITGFAAATYQRGIRFIQIPTTVLAQVASSVGGKTGVNHARGKNMIGAFHQPVCVLADTGVLASLPEREVKAGLAEVLKYGLIVDAEFFEWLTDHATALTSLDADAVARAVQRCCEIKADIVARDERESGVRALLIPSAMPSRPASATAAGGMERPSPWAWSWRRTCRGGSAGWTRSRPPGRAGCSRKISVCPCCHLPI